MHVAIDHAFILLFKVGEVADVYQVVNEDEYSDIVRKRQEEDWVIDDGEKLRVWATVKMSKGKGQVLRYCK